MNGAIWVALTSVYPSAPLPEPQRLFLLIQQSSDCLLPRRLVVTSLLGGAERIFLLYIFGYQALANVAETPCERKIQMSTATGKIGIVGLGLVGSAISERLIATGFEMSGYDINKARMDEFRVAGGAPAASAPDAALGNLFVLLSLPTSDIAASVIEQTESGLAPGVIVIDTTTGEPAQMAAFGARLARRDVLYLDASVGGSSRQVRYGEAMVICGGEPQAFAACAELFRACFSQAFHVGPCGAGARMKLALNLVLGLNRAALAEGLSYARACGLDPALALEIFKAGPAYSRAMDVKGHKMIGGDFTPDARLSQHLKDVRLILATAEACGARAPLSELHRALLEEAEAAGYGAADNSAIIKVFEGAFEIEKGET